MVFDITTITAPALVQTLSIASFDSLHVMNAEQHGNYLYLALGNFFGAPLQKPGMAIVDVTNPLLPVVTDVWKDSVVTKGAAVVTVQGNYAFLGAMTKGLMILDVSDVHNITYVSQYLPKPYWPNASPTASQMPNARGMAMNGNLVYLCYDSGGLRVIDITNINAPVQIGQYINVAALAKQQAYNNIVLNGNLAYIAVDFCGMEVVDISMPSAITETGWWNPYHCESPSNIWLNSPGHTNEIVYIPTDNAVFLSSGGSQCRIVDVTNPALPDSCNGYGLTGTSNGTWGIDVYHNYIYLANITAFIPFSSTWKGLKILSWPSTLVVNEAIEASAAVKVYPNPFVESTDITFYTKQTSAVSIDITDVTERLINHIEKNIISEGRHSIAWDGRNTAGKEVSEGLYFIHVNANKEIITNKVIKVK